MNSNSNPQNNAKSVSSAEALGGPVELDQTPKPPVVGLDRNRLRQIEKEINESIRRNRPSPIPNHIEIDL